MRKVLARPWVSVRVCHLLVLLLIHSLSSSSVFSPSYLSTTNQTLLFLNILEGNCFPRARAALLDSPVWVPHCTTTDEYHVILVSDSKHRKPISLKIYLEGRPLITELDIGSAVLVMSDRVYLENLRHVSLKDTSLKLCIYRGESVKPMSFF